MPSGRAVGGFRRDGDPVRTRAVRFVAGPVYRLRPAPGVGFLTDASQKGR